MNEAKLQRIYNGMQIIIVCLPFLFGSVTAWVLIHFSLFLSPAKDSGMQFGVCKLELGCRSVM